MGTRDTRSVEEYVNRDDDLAVCIDDETLDENNLAQEVAVTVEDESDVDEEFDLSPPSTKIKSHREAIQSLEDIQKVEAE